MTPSVRKLQQHLIVIEISDVAGCCRLLERRAGLVCDLQRMAVDFLDQ
jgi:hypothetical protein